MPQYARYNPTVTGESPVTGWYDTDAHPKLTLPAASATCALQELSAVQWAAHTANGWAISNGELVAYVRPRPPLTLAQQAVAALQAGLTITSAGTPALNDTYGVDPDTTNHIQAEMIALLSSGGGGGTQVFADGGTTVVWPGLAGANHTFSAPQFVALALAVGAYVAALFKCVNGTLTALPAPSANIP